MHHPLHFVGRLHRALQQLDRDRAIPDRAVDGAVDGLMPLFEQPLDLVVGLVDRAHPAGLFFALTPELQSGLGKRGFVVLGRFLERDTGPAPVCGFMGYSHSLRVKRLEFLRLRHDRPNGR